MLREWATPRLGQDGAGDRFDEECGGVVGAGWNPVDPWLVVKATGFK